MATNETDIAAPAADVWAVLADGWSYSNWVVGTSYMRAVEKDWPAQGAKLYHCTGAWPVALRDNTVVESATAPRRLVLMASGRPLGKARIEIDLVDTAHGCHVTMRETPVEGPGHWVLRNPAGDSVLHRRNTEALHRLAAISERRTSIDR